MTICAAAGRPPTRRSTTRPRSWPATACSPTHSTSCRDPKPIRARTCASSWSWRWRAPPGWAAWWAGRSSISRAEGRFPDVPQAADARRGRDPAGDEDRRADPLRLHGGRDPGRSRRRSAARARALWRGGRPGVPDRRRSARHRGRCRDRRQADRQGRGRRQGDHRGRARHRQIEGAAEGPGRRGVVRPRRCSASAPTCSRSRRKFVAERQT